MTLLLYVQPGVSRGLRHLQMSPSLLDILDLDRSGPAHPEQAYNNQNRALTCLQWGNYSPGQAPLHPFKGSVWGQLFLSKAHFLYRSFGWAPRQGGFLCAGTQGVSCVGRGGVSSLLAESGSCVDLTEQRAL